MPHKHTVRGMGGRTQVTRHSRCTGLLLAALIWGVARAAFVNIRLTPCPFRKNSILQKNLA